MLSLISPLVNGILNFESSFINLHKPVKTSI